MPANDLDTYEGLAAEYKILAETLEILGRWIGDVIDALHSECRDEDFIISVGQRCGDLRAAIEEWESL